MKTDDQSVSWSYKVYLSLCLIIILVSLSLALALVSSHKSTKGWSVGNILLDLSGGLASLLQMILVTDNSQDWTSLTGDLTKLGLSADCINNQPRQDWGRNPAPQRLCCTIHLQLVLQLYVFLHSSFTPSGPLLAALSAWHYLNKKILKHY